MISEIQMTTVASFRCTTSLATDTKVNLFYGLNETGLPFPTSSVNQRQIATLDESLSMKQQVVKVAFDRKRSDTADAIWEIKTNHCGGDRVLE